MFTLQQYFSYIVAVSLLVEEIGVPGENHRPVANHWQTLSHKCCIEHTLPWTGFELKTVVIGTDCTGSCKSNYHTSTTTPTVQTESLNKAQKQSKTFQVWNKILFLLTIKTYPWKMLYNLEFILYNFQNSQIISSKSDQNFWVVSPGGNWFYLYCSWWGQAKVLS
jgi:hypothetical protein